MTAVADPTNTAAGIAKRVHGKVQDLIPEKMNVVLRTIPFDTESPLGGTFAEQVWLTGEWGFTHGGTDGAGLTLVDPAVAESKLAEAAPESLHFRSRSTIELLSRAQGKGEASFENYVKRLMVNSKKAFDRRLNTRMTYGGLSLATVLTGDAGTATTWAPTISIPTWAPWLWLGGKGCPVDAYTTTTKLNTTSALTITNVNPKTRVISFEGASADMTAIKAVGTNGSTVTLYYKGGYSTTATGIKTIAKLSSSSGNFEGIATGTYSDVWNATQVTWDVTADDFTWTILQNGLEESFGRGGGGDRIAFVPPGVWKTLNSSLDALRAFDSSYSVSKVEMGHKIDAIVYYALGFKITVMCSGDIMGGDVIVVPDPDDNEDFRRRGSSNVTFELPNEGGKMFIQIQGTNYVEHGAFSDQVLWTTAPRDFLYFGP